MLTSLQENNPQQTFQIHIITDFKSIKLSLLKSVIRRYGNSFSVYCLDDAFIGRMKHFKLSNHAQLANYYRLLATIEQILTGAGLQDSAVKLIFLS